MTPSIRSHDTERVSRFFRIFSWIVGGLLLLRIGAGVGRSAEGRERFVDFLAALWEPWPGKVFLVGAPLLWIVSRFVRIDRFVLHAATALVGIATLNYFITNEIPLAIKGIASSYLIFFYHFPAALSCFFFFALVMVFSIMVLRTGDPLWDRCARVSAEIGVLTVAIVLVTGSTWASAAWGHWWIWDDPRLMSAAIMGLTYAGYLTLQTQLEDPETRRRYAAVFGILAFLNIPLVHFAIRWFGKVSHPMKFDEFASDMGIVATRWLGVAVFFIFYCLVFRWQLTRTLVRDRLEENLGKIRRLEEGAPA